MFGDKSNKEVKAAQLLAHAHARRTAQERINGAEQQKRAELSRSYSSILDRINKKLSPKDKQPLADEVQIALAKAVGLLVNIPSADECWLRNHPHLIDAVDTSVTALLSEPPNVKLANQLEADIDRLLHPLMRTCLFASLKRSVRSAPSAVVACGLGIVFLAIGTLLAILSIFHFPIHPPGDLIDSSSQHIYTDGLLLIGMAGALGSIVSIMIRIQDFSYTGREDPWPFLLLGLFKPMVGAAFALFTLAAISAAFLPLDIPDDAGDLGYFFLALAFVAGFSERFAGDMIASTEHFVLDTGQHTSKDGKDRSDEGAHNPNGNGKVEETLPKTEEASL